MDRIREEHLSTNVETPSPAGFLLNDTFLPWVLAAYFVIVPSEKIVAKHFLLRHMTTTYMHVNILTEFSEVGTVILL